MFLTFIFTYPSFSIALIESSFHHLIVDSDVWLKHYDSFNGFESIEVHRR